MELKENHQNIFAGRHARGCSWETPTEDFVLFFEISKYRHDRSYLEISEADGVDGRAFCKRGLIHLQFAEKPEAPEVERHLETQDLE
ncbi:hypothetical protein V1478_016321 [Vespula squamosa]|uniref:Uncharacterized protein n=1 Tax=Vespula squamosa TaxID=30214 RepID=A0ABD1ZZG7_VESSQ